MFEEVFTKKKICFDKLIKYGFIYNENKYIYECEIMNGDFLLQIIFNKQGHLNTILIDKETGEEYTLYKTRAQGAFIGKTRESITTVLQDISKKCFTPSIYNQSQALKLISYADEVYGDKAEFPFDSTPHTCIIRRKESQKWYIVILKIPKTKLGLDSEQIIEVVNLHSSAERVKQLLNMPHFFPGWHMNKKRWYTVILDGSIPDEELFKLVDESYTYAKK